MNFRRLKMNISDDIEFESYIGSWPTEDDREWILETCADSKILTPEESISLFMPPKPEAIDGAFFVSRVYRRKSDNERIMVVCNRYDIPNNNITFSGIGIHPDHRRQGHGAGYSNESWAWAEANPWFHENIKTSIYLHHPVAGHRVSKDSYEAKTTNRGQILLIATAEDIYNES
jgi:hypothetical protein